MTEPKHDATTIDLDEARRILGLKSLSALGRCLGYNGNGLRQQMYALKTGRKAMGPDKLWRLQALLDGYRPPDWRWP